MSNGFAKLVRTLKSHIAKREEIDVFVPFRGSHTC